MNGTSPRFLKAFPLILLLMTGLACPAFSEDIQTLIKKAEGGDLEAQVYLGAAYDQGQGIPQDYAEAAKWWQKAAEQGHAGAQYNLGISYGKGQGVPQDYAESMRWYRMAAEQGHAKAQNNRGVAYSKGQGVPKD